MAQSVKQEPCALLFDTERASQFIGGDTVLGGNQKPESSKPFVQAEGAVFHDRTRLDRELLLAFLAFPDTAGREEGNPTVYLTCGFEAMGTLYAVRPTQRNDVFMGDCGIGECLDGFHEGFRGFHISMTVLRMSKFLSSTY